jgi:hypothetical protein
MAEKTSFWTIFNAVVGGTAAIVTALTGIYLAVKQAPATSANPGLPVTATAVDPELQSGTIYERTPWLGVELRQHDRPVRLRSIDSAWDKFEATIGTGPFELVISRRADDPAIGILAWQDDSIYEFVRGGTFHLPGTGIAGAEFAVPILYLNKEGFNYYHTERMKRVNDNAYSIFISSIAASELELPLPRFAGPLYLIIFRVPTSDMQVPSHDFELITLRRP